MTTAASSSTTRRMDLEQYRQPSLASMDSMSRFASQNSDNPHASSSHEDSLNFELLQPGEDLLGGGGESTDDDEDGAHNLSQMVLGRTPLHHSTGRLLLRGGSKSFRRTTTNNNKSSTSVLSAPLSSSTSSLLTSTTTTTTTTSTTPTTVTGDSGDKQNQYLRMDKRKLYRRAMKNFLSVDLPDQEDEDTIEPEPNQDGTNTTTRPDDKDDTTTSHLDDTSNPDTYNDPQDDLLAFASFIQSRHCHPENDVFGNNNDDNKTTAPHDVLPAGPDTSETHTTTTTTTNHPIHNNNNNNHRMDNRRALLTRSTSHSSVQSHSHHSNHAAAPLDRHGRPPVSRCSSHSSQGSDSIVPFQAAPSGTTTSSSTRGMLLAAAGRSKSHRSLRSNDSTSMDSTAGGLRRGRPPLPRATSSRSMESTGPPLRTTSASSGRPGLTRASSQYSLKRYDEQQSRPPPRVTRTNSNGSLTGSGAGERVLRPGLARTQSHASLHSGSSHGGSLGGVNRVGPRRPDLMRSQSQHSLSSKNNNHDSHARRGDPPRVGGTTTTTTGENTISKGGATNNTMGRPSLSRSSSHASLNHSSSSSYHRSNTNNNRLGGEGPPTKTMTQGGRPGLTRSQSHSSLQSTRSNGEREDATFKGYSNNKEPPRGAFQSRPRLERNTSHGRLMTTATTKTTINGRITNPPIPPSRERGTIRPSLERNHSHGRLNATTMDRISPAPQPPSNDPIRATSGGSVRPSLERNHSHSRLLNPAQPSSSQSTTTNARGGGEARPSLDRNTSHGRLTTESTNSQQQPAVTNTTWRGTRPSLDRNTSHGRLMTTTDNPPQPPPRINPQNNDSLDRSRTSRDRPALIRSGSHPSLSSNNDVQAGTPGNGQNSQTKTILLLQSSRHSANSNNRDGVRHTATSRPNHDKSRSYHPSTEFRATGETRGSMQLEDDPIGSTQDKVESPLFEPQEWAVPSPASPKPTRTDLGTTSQQHSPYSNPGVSHDHDDDDEDIDGIVLQDLSETTDIDESSTASSFYSESNPVSLNFGDYYEQPDPLATANIASLKTKPSKDNDDGIDAVIASVLALDDAVSEAPSAMVTGEKNIPSSNNLRRAESHTKVSSQKRPHATQQRAIQNKRESGPGNRSHRQPQVHDESGTASSKGDHVRRHPQHPHHNHHHPTGDRGPQPPQRKPPDREVTMRPQSRGISPHRSRVMGDAQGTHRSRVMGDAQGTRAQSSRPRGASPLRSENGGQSRIRGASPPRRGSGGGYGEEANPSSNSPRPTKPVRTSVPSMQRGTSPPRRRTDAQGVSSGPHGSRSDNRRTGSPPRRKSAGADGAIRMPQKSEPSDGPARRHSSPFRRSAADEHGFEQVKSPRDHKVHATVSSPSSPTGRRKMHKNKPTAPDLNHVLSPHSPKNVSKSPHKISTPTTPKKSGTNLSRQLRSPGKVSPGQSPASTPSIRKKRASPRSFAADFVVCKKKEPKTPTRIAKEKEGREHLEQSLADLVESMLEADQSERGEHDVPDRRRHMQNRVVDSTNNKSPPKSRSSRHISTDTNKPKPMQPHRQRPSSTLRGLHQRSDQHPHGKREPEHRHEPRNGGTSREHKPSAEVQKPVPRTLHRNDQQPPHPEQQNARYPTRSSSMDSSTMMGRDFAAARSQPSLLTELSRGHHGPNKVANSLAPMGRTSSNDAATLLMMESKTSSSRLTHLRNKRETLRKEFALKTARMLLDETISNHSNKHHQQQEHLQSPVAQQRKGKVEKSMEATLTSSPTISTETITTAPTISTSGTNLTIASQSKPTKDRTTTKDLVLSRAQSSTILGQTRDKLNEERQRLDQWKLKRTTTEETESTYYTSSDHNPQSLSPVLAQNTAQSIPPELVSL